MPEVTNADLMDMMASDESPSGISDKIKDILFAKSAERIDTIRPDVATNMFGQDEPEEEPEVETEVSSEPESEPEDEE
jgi:hypothetical protein|tara:strand:- start:831 stop:1064 length:234 start_codon:yes stop_codon:yes gene_type:complete